MKLVKEKLNTNGQMARTKEMLIAKISELKQNLKSREDIALIQASDIMDAVQLAENRELAIETIQRSTRLLTHVWAALARLEEGTYGTCQDCDSQIAERRLTAIPWAVRCVSCEEKAEQERSEERRVGKECA